MKIQIKNNSITNDGEPIGVLDGQTVYLHQKVGPRVKSEIKKAVGDDGLKFIEQAAPDAEPAPVEAPKPAPEPPRARTLEEATKLAAIKTKDAAYRSLIVAVERGDIPPPPKQLAALGDKTPEFVAWVRENATPEEFNAIYGNRKLPTLQDYQNGERKRRRIAGEKLD